MQCLKEWNQKSQTNLTAYIWRCFFGSQAFVFSFLKSYILTRSSERPFRMFQTYCKESSCINIVWQFKQVSKQAVSFGYMRKSIVFQTVTNLFTNHWQEYFQSFINRTIPVIQAKLIEPREWALGKYEQIPHLLWKVDLIVETFHLKSTRSGKSHFECKWQSYLYSSCRISQVICSVQKYLTK